jgi:hypothetical protein
LENRYRTILIEKLKEKQAEMAKKARCCWAIHGERLIGGCIEAELSSQTARTTRDG